MAATAAKKDAFAFQANPVRACGLPQIDLIRYEIELINSSNKAIPLHLIRGGK